MCLFRIGLDQFKETSLESKGRKQGEKQADEKEDIKLSRKKGRNEIRTRMLVVTERT